MIEACGESVEVQATGDGDRRYAIRGRAVAELAVEVVTPAVCRPGAGEHTRVRVAGGERSREDIHGRWAGRLLAAHRYRSSQYAADDRYCSSQCHILLLTSKNLPHSYSG